MISFLLHIVFLSCCLADPLGSVRGLIDRMLGPSQVSRFQLEVIPADPQTGLDVFEIDHNNTLVVLRGNTGVTIANALNNYLKYQLNASISWGRDRSGILVNLPPQLPLPSPQRVVLPMKWRYAWNVCTPGYSFVWYSYEQWQFLIDWMALQGVNLPLAFNGQEAIFAEVYKKIGLTDQEIWAYFSGPAFLPWNRMGNMQAFGALNTQVKGLDNDWMDSQKKLQLQIVASMRDFGMTPVLPGFGGHVPSGLKRIFPNSNFSHSSDWCGFNATYGSVTLLQPTDPAFLTVGSAINSAILEAFGDPTGQEIPVLNADMYNEMVPESGDLDYLAACNEGVYKAMTLADPRTVYMMQAWLFYNAASFWTYDRTKAFLSSVPIGKLLLLDLFSDESPQWSKYDSFFGHDWIWNSLIVFGGRRGIYGSLPNLATSPYLDRAAAKNMIGVGVTPEAIDMNQPMFDITLEAGWRNAAPDQTEWMQQYAVRRYGKQSTSMSAAYILIQDAAYNNRAIDPSIIEMVPSVNPQGSRNTNATGLLNALRSFVTAFSGELDPTSGPASYDLTDLNRQVLCNLFQDLHGVFAARYTTLLAAGGGPAAVPELAGLTSQMLTMIDLLDTVNGADVNFLLGPWLTDAAQWGFNESQRLNRLYNARNQITQWGPNGEINDYAAKVGWAGLVRDYYLVRWQSLTQYLLSNLKAGQIPDWDKWLTGLKDFERAWSFNTTMFPTTPSGDSPLRLAQEVLAAYASPPAGFTLHADQMLVDSDPKWAQVGSSNMAAIGADCPWVAHSNASTVAGCEDACKVLSTTCNVVNFDGANCELRQCANPSRPALSPLSGWSVYGNAAGRSGIFAAWHLDPGVLAFLCNTTPSCQGFTSEGIIVGSGATLRSASSVMSWIKK